MADICDRHLKGLWTCASTKPNKERADDIHENFIFNWFHKIFGIYSCRPAIIFVNSAWYDANAGEKFNNTSARLYIVSFIVIWAEKISVLKNGFLTKSYLVQKCFHIIKNMQQHANVPQFVLSGVWCNFN